MSPRLTGPIGLNVVHIGGSAREAFDRRRKPRGAALLSQGRVRQRLLELSDRRVPQHPALDT